MPYKVEKVVEPESVVLEDGRKGYFIDVSITTGAVVVVKYPSTPGRKRAAAKTVVAKKANQSHTSRSVLTAFKEVKSRKSNNKYPGKDFDSLMDEL